MSRRRKAIKRQIMPDPKFNDKIVSKFTSLKTKDAIADRFRNKFYNFIY